MMNTYPFKDRKELQNRNIRAQENALKEVADIVRKFPAHSDERKKALLGYLPNRFNSKEHLPNHSLCDWNLEKDNPECVTEKRVCRCMYYSNRDVGHEFNTEQQEKCKECRFVWKKENRGKYAVIDYEYPVNYNILKLGGIDLLLGGMDEIEELCQEKSKPPLFASAKHFLWNGVEMLLPFLYPDEKEKLYGTMFAVEVKPEQSKESLARMFAEIITYNEFFDNEWNYIPSICFFKGSIQCKDFLRFKNNDDVKTILEEVEVFYLTYDEESFRIHRYSKEPLE